MEDGSTAFLVLWVLWGVQAASCVMVQILYPRAMRRQVETWSGQSCRPAVVVVSMKGTNRWSGRFVQSLLKQDYPRYRVIVSFESDDDEAAGLLRAELGLPVDGRCRRMRPEDPEPGEKFSAGLREVRLVTAGRSTWSGQKVHNQIAAMAEIDDGDSLVAFVDADIDCDERWLVQLLAPLNAGTHHFATGYRWLVPERGTLVNHTAAAANASVATLGGFEAGNVLWGGSMALTRTAFQELDVPSLFDGSLNDDLHLARAARLAGWKIAYVRSLLIPSPVDYSWRSFSHFVRRQYFQVRHYTPKLFFLSILGTWGYTLGWMSALVAGLSGSTVAWAVWAGVFFSEQVRAALRRRLARSLFDAETFSRLRGAFLLEHFATPWWMTAHAVLALSSVVMRQVVWSGVVYRVRGRKQTEVVRRFP